MINFIKLSIFLLSFSFLLLAFTNTAHANQSIPFKHFSDYMEITQTKHSAPVFLRTHYWAKQKINDRPKDPTYKKK